MSQSALAACMAPLLLRPLLLGECEIDNDFSMGGDGSFQLLQAAAAANHAQAIVIVMLEKYDQIFDDLEEGSCSSDAYTDSEDDDVDKEYSTDNDIHDEHGSYDSGEDEIEEELDDNSEHSSSGSAHENNTRTVIMDDKGEDASQMKINSQSEPKHSCESNKSNDHTVKSNPCSSASGAKSIDESISSSNKGKRTLWGRTSARKDLSTEEVECCSDDEILVDKLENNKADLQSKIRKEIKENGVLQVSLERRKEELLERRLALEKEVENLREQLQKERNLRASLESGLMNMRRGQVSLPSTIDNKTKADLEEVATAESDVMNLKQKASDLRGQVNNQQLFSSLLCESCNKRLLDANKLFESERNVSLSSENGSNFALNMADRAQSKKQTSPNSTDISTHDEHELLGSHRAQRMLSSKGEEIVPFDVSSSTSRWTFAQKHYSNSPFIRGRQGVNYSKLEESGNAPAANALAKLTNRLNFLKERRALLASEMKSLDLGRPQAQAQAQPQSGAAAAPPRRDPSPR